MGASEISWTLTPTNSWILQLLVNLTVGIAAGVGLALVLNVALAFRLLARHGVSTWVVGLLVLFLVFAVGRSIGFIKAARSDQERIDTVGSEWWDAVRWSRVTIVALPFTVILVALGLRYGYWLAPRMRLLHLAGFGIALAILSITHAAIAEGTIDPVERTLTYTRYTRSTREIELDNLSNVSTFVLGDLTAVRFQFHPGTVSSIIPRYVVMPTETTEDARRVFKQAVAHEPAAEPDPQVRQQMFVGAAILLGMTIILGWMFYVGTGVFWYSVYFAGLFGIPAFIVLVIAFRS